MINSESSSRTIKIMKSGIINGLWFAVIGIVFGALGGVLIGGMYEYSTGNSGGNAPLAFILTGPIGCLIGLGYGIWKELH